MNARKQLWIVVPLLLALMALSLPARTAPWPVAEQACWYIHLDHHAYSQSHIGQLLRSVWGEDYNKAMNELKGRMKIDLEKDLRNLSIFGWGMSKEFVIDLQGNLDLSSMLKRIQENTKALPEKARAGIGNLKITRSGKTSWLSLDEHAFLAQNKPGHIYFSPNKARLEAVMRQPSWNPASEVKDILGKAPQHSFLTFAALGFSETLKSKAPQAAMLGNTQWALMTLSDNGPHSQLTIKLMTEGPEKAKNLYQVTQGLLSLARLKMLAPDDDDKVPDFVPALLNALELTQKDAELHLSLKLTREQIQTIMKEMRESDKKKKCDNEEDDEETEEEEDGE